MKATAILIAPALVGAALAGYFLADHRSASAATAGPTEVAQQPAAAASTPALPPNHPAIPGAGPRAPHGNGSMPNGENQRPPSIEWKVPESFQVAPNANPMRLATYHAQDGTELTVSRAGGPVDSNILRWSQQFDGAPKPERQEKTVKGLHTIVVRLAGTYSGGMGTTAPESHPGWAMLAAIVEAPGAPYFFKVVGPAAQVDAARAAFDATVDSVTPRPTP